MAVEEIDMGNSTDAGFEAWLASLPALGYDGDWIGRNITMLRKRFDAGVIMQRCPPPPQRRLRDRYEEL